MTKRVTVRLKVDEALRSQFKDAAWRSHLLPAQVLRSMMEKFVELEKHRGVDLTVWSNMTRAADAVVPEPAPVEKWEHWASRDLR
jgi:hypothetical protein